MLIKVSELTDKQRADRLRISEKVLEAILNNQSMIDAMSRQYREKVPLVVADVCFNQADSMIWRETLDALPDEQGKKLVVQ